MIYPLSMAFSLLSFATFVSKAATRSFNAGGKGGVGSFGSALSWPTWELEELIRHDNDDMFGTGTVALEVGDEIWVGSLRGDRIARFSVN